MIDIPLHIGGIMKRRQQDNQTNRKIIKVKKQIEYVYLCSGELIYRVLLCLMDSTEFESECFVSGIRIGNTLIPMRILKPKLAIRTIVSAKADPVSMYNLYLYIQKWGLNLYLMAHLHPGYSSGSVYPSGRDIMTLRRWERNFPLIGVILNRSGYFRFFSVNQKFRIKMEGRSVEQYDEKFYKINYEKSC